MNRPKRILIIGLFLIIWNVIKMFLKVPQAIFGNDFPLIFKILSIVSISSILYIFIGIYLLLNKNWARICYLIIAPSFLIWNIIGGYHRVGNAVFLDYTPSIIITTSFIILLISKRARLWFQNYSMSSKANTLTIPNLTKNITKDYYTQSLWDSLFIITFRWMGYIPITLILLSILEFLLTLFLNWVVSLSWLFIIIVMLFLGSETIIAYFFIYHYSLILGNKIICPKPNMGSIIFVLPFAISSIYYTVNIFQLSQSLFFKFIVVLIRIITFIILFFTILKCYDDD